MRGRLRLASQPHASDKCGYSDRFVPAATCAATPASPDATYAATSAPSPMIEHVVQHPVVTHAAPAPVIEYVSSAPAIEYIAPAPAVTLDVPSQQLHPTYVMTTMTTDVNSDITGLVNPQFSITAVGSSAPQVVVSLPLSAEFGAPVYDQIHQEQIVAGEMTPNTIENPAVQEKVIVQEIPQAPQVVVHFLQKSMLHPCATKSFWNKSLRQWLLVKAAMF